jgi:hypothetical protein
MMFALHLHEIEKSSPGFAIPTHGLLFITATDGIDTN